MDDPRERELASLRRRLAESEENLRLIRERTSQYVMATSIPLQLIKTERRLEWRIFELGERLARLEEIITETRLQTGKASIVTSGYTDESLEEVRKIQDASSRAKALTGLISHLPTSARDEVLREALTAAWDIQDTNARSDVLTALVPHLLETVRAASDRASEASALGILGLTYADLGDISRAIGYYEQILALVQEIGDRQAEGETRSNLGVAYDALGDFSRAIEQYEQAISIARQMGDKYAEAIRLQNLGLVLLRLADAEPDQSEAHLSRAAELLQQALRLFEMIEAAPLLRARARYHLGRCYHRAGRWREATTLLEQARETFSQHKAYPELAHALLELGQLYHQRQDFESAYIYLKDALRLFRRLKDTDGIAVTQEALGSLALLTGRPSKAIDSLQEARRGYTALRRTERIRAVDDLLHIAHQARQPVGGTAL